MKICTQESPWDGILYFYSYPHPGDDIWHIDAKIVRDSPDDNTVTYHCPHCHHTWEQESSQ